MKLTYEQFLAALTLWREARGSSKDAKVAVWHVILNRVAQAHKPSSIQDVVLAPKQFSSWNVKARPDLGLDIYQTDPNAWKFPTPSFPADWAAWLDCVGVVVNPTVTDPTGGANHYEDCPVGKLPVWADPTKITATIGPFRFYRL
jgi:N-acetylmuramoyl-L-alanine amidase